MKSITKHLVKSAFILAMVTAASLGIRQIRFKIHQARTVESPVIAESEAGHLLAELDTANDEYDKQYAFASEPDKRTPSDEKFEAHTDMDKDSKVISKTKPSKSKKGLEKISLGDNEDLYVTKDGELWYVSKQSDGSVTKMQVYIDEATGQMNVINIYDGKSGGSKSLEKISMSDNEDLYITGEGELWYVSKQADGSTTKNQALIDDTTGEMILIDSGDGGK